MRILKCFVLLALLISPVVFAEDADAVREKGIAALKDSQTNPRAIVEAARLFVKAAALYSDAGNEEKNVEMNSFLYWCKKKMTMADIDAFTKGGEAAVSTKLAALEKAAPKADEAEKWFERAEQFAKKNPNEHLLIAIRFYEVADRFKGSDASLRAQDRSLKEQLEDKTAAPKMIVPPVAVSTPNPAPANGGNQPVPPAAKLKDAEKVIKDLFKADYAKTDAPSRRDLATKLLQQADENKDDPASLYVLLHEARDMSVASGDVALAMSTQKRLCTSFGFNFAAILNDLKPLDSQSKTEAPAVALAEIYSAAAKEALEVDNFEQAVRFMLRAEDLLPAIKDAALKQRLKSELDAAMALKRDSIAALAALKILATKPDDPEANFTAGKFALERGRFAAAFALLAKGKDLMLSLLAKREMVAPTDAAEQLKMADEWFDRAEKEQYVYLKTPMQERAAVWYSNVLPTLIGLPKIKVEARLKNLPAVAIAARPEPASAKNEAKIERQGVNNVLDLLSIVNTKYDVVQGTWKKTSSGLHCEGSTWNKLQIPYYPPEDYDLRFQFTREANEGEIAVMLSIGKKQGMISFFRSKSYAGLSIVNSRQAHQTGNRTRTEISALDDHKYSAVIHVRKSVVSVELDGTRLFEIDTAKDDISTQENWHMKDPRALGLLSGSHPAMFHNVFIVEISGKGEFARGAVAAVAAESANDAQTVDVVKNPGVWISKNATCKLSSIWPEMPQASPDLFNGTGGGFKKGSGKDDFGFSTNNETDPWIVIDLKAVYDLQSVQLVTRRSLLNRAAPMIMYQGETENGPWIEMWRTEERKPEYAVAVSGKTRYIKIVRTGKNHFHMYSIKVFAKPDGDAGKGER